MGRPRLWLLTPRRPSMARAAKTLTLVAMLGVTACVVGPQYQAPEMPLVTTFAGAVEPGLSADEAALTEWWRGFADPMLTELVTRAVANNYDLRIAAANLRKARALYRLQRYDRAPTVRAGAAYSDQLLSKAAAPGLDHDARQSDLFEAGFDALWELDLFGRVRRNIEAARAETEAVEAIQRDVLVSVTAEVARNYFELRGGQNQINVARRNADVQAETLKITQSRLDGGRGTAFDVARSSAQLNLTQSTIPGLEAAVRTAMYRLAVLTGSQPGALTDELSGNVALPAAMSLPALGDPAALIRRRADVRVAERILAADTARIGIATADLFPRVVFVGSVGLAAGSVGGLGDSGAGNWQFGPHISWAAFDLGRVRARIAASNAQAEASLANYERTVLEALEETESALVAFGQQQARQLKLTLSAEASQQAVALAHQRYDAGVADFLSVLDAQRTLLEAQDRLADSLTRTGTAVVAVYKALGGGIPVVDGAMALAPSP